MTGPWNGNMPCPMMSQPHSLQMKGHWCLALLRHYLWCVPVARRAPYQFFSFQRSLHHFLQGKRDCWPWVKCDFRWRVMTVMTVTCDWWHVIGHYMIGGEWCFVNLNSVSVQIVLLNFPRNLDELQDLLKKYLEKINPVHPHPHP